MKHLIYDLRSAPAGHPQVIMNELGITYVVAMPQSMFDQWWFWSCFNVPDPLPTYLAETYVNPHTMIGFGLSRQEANQVTAALAPAAAETRVFICAERAIGNQLTQARKEIDLYLLRYNKLSGEMLLAELNAVVKEVEESTYGQR